MTMRHLDLFSGIGGFALATEMVWDNVEHIFCDNDPFAQAVLRKHWPNSPVFSDIKRFNVDVRNAMIAICEEQTDSALCAEYQKRLSDVPIASHATVNESRSGEEKIQSDTAQTNENGSNPVRIKLFPTTEEGVFVAEKQSESSSPLTTNLTTETQSVGNINRRHGSSPSSEDSQTITNSSATTATTLKLITEYVLTKPIDLLTGGFPCQPFSAAGRRKGTEDDRHLWPSMLETIRLLCPTYVLGENVGGFLTWDGGLVFEQVCTDLEAEGYEVCPFVIPACAVNAPHRRDRVWIAAHALGGNAGGAPRAIQGTKGTKGTKWIPEWNNLAESGESGNVRDASDTSFTGLQGFRSNGEGQYGQRDREERKERRDWTENWPEVAARLCVVDDGLRHNVVGLDGRTNAEVLPRPKGWRNAALKGAGNAIVPQVAAEILWAVKQTMV